MRPCSDNRRVALWASILAMFLVAGTSTSLIAQSPQAIIDPLQELISGSVFEIGKKASNTKYEVYQYEDYRTDGCSIQWKETHQILESGHQVSLTIQVFTVPLAAIDPLSVRDDRYESGHVVSFTTINLERRIKARGKNVYADSSEDWTISYSSGSGFYFSETAVAKKVAVALSTRIKSCKV